MMHEEVCFYQCLGGYRVEVEAMSWDVAPPPEDDDDGGVLGEHVCYHEAAHFLKVVLIQANNKTF